MPDVVNALAAEAAAAFPGGLTYTYAAQDAMTAASSSLTRAGSRS